MYHGKRGGEQGEGIMVILLLILLLLLLHLHLIPLLLLILLILPHYMLILLILQQIEKEGSLFKMILGNGRSLLAEKVSSLLFFLVYEIFFL